MSQSDRERWNARYANRRGADREELPAPAQVLIQGARWLPGGFSSASSASPIGDLHEEDGDALTDSSEQPDGMTAAPAGAPVSTDDMTVAQADQARMDENDAVRSSRDRFSALDLACGRADNGRWLAEHGFQVSAWDVSDVVISQIRQRVSNPALQTEVRDVIVEPPLPDSFDVIVVVRFLERALCPAIARALKPGGVLFYQSFTQGLSNPDYCLRENELLSLFESLRILEYHEPPPDSEGRAEARLIARRE